MIIKLNPQFRYIKGIRNLSELHDHVQLTGVRVRIVKSYMVAVDYGKTVFGRYPHLALLWDYEKNIGIDPREVYAKSQLYVWWTCGFGHSVYRKVRTMTRYSQCTVCAKMTTPITGSLLEKYPLLAKEWDYAKNKPLLPEAIKPCHREKVWWICPARGHSYAASPDNRVGKKSGCRRCVSAKPRKKRK